MVAERLHCGDDKQTPLRTQLGHQSAALQEVLDLCGEIKGQVWKLLVHRANDAYGVPRPVQKIRVPKRNVRRACLHLPPNVLKDDGFRNEEEVPVIDRHDWAMETVMEATTTGLDVPDQPFRAVLFEPCILVQHR